MKMSFYYDINVKSRPKCLVVRCNAVTKMITNKSMRSTFVLNLAECQSDIRLDTDFQKGLKPYHPKKFIIWSNLCSLTYPIALLALIGFPKTVEIYIIM